MILFKFLVLLRRFEGKKCDDRRILNLEGSAHTILRDILDLKLKMKDPRVDLVAAMDSLRNLAKEWIQIVSKIIFYYN